MLVAKSWAVPLNLHPLYLYVLVFMLGIWAHMNGYTGACACFLPPLIFLGPGRSSDALKITVLSFLFFTGGAYRIQQHTQPYLDLFSQKEFQSVQCSGTVYDIQPYRHPYFKQRITITTDLLRSTKDPKLVHELQGYVYLFASADEVFTLDDTVTIDNLIVHQPKSPRDCIRRVKDKVIGSLFQKKGAWSCKKTDSTSWKQYVFAIKARITDAVCSSMNTASKTLYASLFLGNKTLAPLSTAIISGFSLWGISHHLARSGLHLIIVIWLWSLYVQRAPFSHGIKHILLIILGCIYYLFSWPTLSFNRAFLSFLLYQTCLWSKNRLDPLQGIAWITFCFLMLSPVDLFSLDFQLSFGLTHALGWFNHLHSKLHKVSQ